MLQFELRGPVRGLVTVHHDSSCDDGLITTFSLANRSDVRFNAATSENRSLYSQCFPTIATPIVGERGMKIARPSITGREPLFETASSRAKLIVGISTRQCCGSEEASYSNAKIL